MEYTVSDANRRPDGPARMEPGGAGDVECRQPIPGPELVLARRYAGTLARLARRVDFTVRPITTGGRRFQWDGRETGIHAAGTEPEGRGGMSDDITVTVILSTADDPGSGVIVGINHAAGEELGDIRMNPDVNGDSLRAAIAGMTFISQGARERLAGRFEDGMGGLEFDDRMRVVATDRQVDRLAASLFLQNLQLLALARGEQPPLVDPEKAWGTADEEMKGMTRDMARIMLDRVRKAEP